MDLNQVEDIPRYILCLFRPAISENQLSGDKNQKKMNNKKDK
jgi:hypothetical protein